MSMKIIFCFLLLVNVSYSMSVIDAGAIPDGKADSTTAFTIALKSGIADVPIGQYYLSKPLVVSSNTMLRGHGPQSIIIGTLLLDKVN